VAAVVIGAALVLEWRVRRLRETSADVADVEVADRNRSVW